ncbi:B12-binding domain-containing radical SAM protein [Oscillochloris sp. ZM17-4]|uniref:B12-binding domain-containing radical SAM protein n=1 Tax=Oscillochloris sp. ZM17-4 TaxID=2866714 RepID=UPI001C73DF8D|nr:radical SAM protein [Oscillochloris sp. ZM17-4]MBX0326385.1 B12-binding domain-containing radical SAM protein [Oscillochloris sp. ZM17-4]
MSANGSLIELTPTSMYAPLRPVDSIRPLKILLITPKGKKEEDTSQKALFSMAVGVLVSITPPQHEIELVDELFGDVVNYDGGYDMVGITTRTLNATRAYEIADRFRARGIPVVLGGVHVSFNYDEALAHADCVVSGEAENLWANVLQDVADGKLQRRYEAVHFAAVNEVPVIDYERIFLCSKRGKVDSRKSIPIYMTRGCPFTCSFCVTPNFTGRLYRIQSPDSIREQIATAKRVWFRETRYGDKPWFMFTDENLGVNKQRMWEIMEILSECNIRFSSFISLKFLDDAKTVELLVKAGCAMALVGFESINQETLKTYNKGRINTAADYSRIISDCRKAGLPIQGNFLVNPEIDTYEDMDATMDFVVENALVMPIYSILTPYPGTELYKEYKAKGLVVDEDWDKYTAHNLVVRCDRYDPYEYQIKYIEHFLGMFTWRANVRRVLMNNNKLITTVTSILFRRNLKDQLENCKHGSRRPIAQDNLPPPAVALSSESIETAVEAH